MTRTGLDAYAIRLLAQLLGKCEGFGDVARALEYLGMGHDTNEADQDETNFKAALEQASGKAIRDVSPTVLTWRLKALRDAPSDIDGKRLVLRYTADTSGHGGDFRVDELRR